MTPEQRERARRMIETAAGAKEKSAAGIRKIQQSRDNKVADEREADADALRAVLEMLDAEPVGWARWYEETGVIGTLVYRTIEQTGGVPVVPVVALLPVRKGGE